MKKITFLLMPVMPGFEAWAVHGFVENASDADAKPEPLSKDSLSRLLVVSPSDLFDGVFVPYSHLAFLVEVYKGLSASQDIRPLDRGGLLMSFKVTDDDFKEKLEPDVVYVSK